MFNDRSKDVIFAIMKDVVWLFCLPLIAFATLVGDLLMENKRK